MSLPSDADSELISAYLDNQITPAERAALESRLTHDPALQHVLDDMRAMVGMLRALEPVRPPRSFALDPATMAPRAWALPAMWLRFGSAVAVVLFAITLTFDLTDSRGLASGGTNASSAAAPAQYAPNSADALPAATMAPMAKTRIGMAAVATAAPAAEVMAAAAPAATEDAATAAPGTEVMAAAVPAATEDAAIAAQSGALSANAGISDPQSSSPGTAVFEAQTTAAPAPPPAHPLLLTEIGFGALALLLLLASFYVTRRRG